MNKLDFESDEVKAYVQQLQAEKGILAQQLNQLKAENDNIKETFDGLFKVQYKLADNNKKLRQCLTEIKEIAENLITITDEYDNCYHKDECDKCLLGINGDCQYFKVEQILQKISECEGNDA